LDCQRFLVIIFFAASAAADFAFCHVQLLCLSFDDRLKIQILKIFCFLQHQQVPGVVLASGFQWLANFLFSKIVFIALFGLISATCTNNVLKNNN
jgi:hypothetical protein